LKNTHFGKKCIYFKECKRLQKGIHDEDSHCEPITSTKLCDFKLGESRIGTNGFETTIYIMLHKKLARIMEYSLMEH